jgi:hypothetical protein
MKGSVFEEDARDRRAVDKAAGAITGNKVLRFS